VDVILSSPLMTGTEHEMHYVIQKT